MDTLFHGVVGAALCSRAGLLGNLLRKHTPDTTRPRFFDWTFFAALFFGLFPDLFSLGIHFGMNLIGGRGVQWVGIPDFVFFLYNLLHSLLGIAIGYALLVAWKRAIWLPALAWPLHVLADILTHGTGHFITPILWPFSTWGFSGWSWWMHPSLFFGGWIFAILLWVAVINIHFKRKNKELFRTLNGHLTTDDTDRHE